MKYNFLAEGCIKKLVSALKKYSAKTTSIAKLKIWLNDPNIPKEIKDNKTRKLKVCSFEPIILYLYCNYNY